MVDIYTHYDGQARWDPELSPSSRHGVTTVSMLGYWARDRRRGPGLPVELAVHLQTRRTAELVSFHDRGLVVPGSSPT